MKKLEDMDFEKIGQLFPIILKEYNPDYPFWYQVEKTKLLGIFHDYCVYRINHIGSTSVVGILAKPIIDILLELPEEYHMREVEKLLEQNGWNLIDKNDDEKTIDMNKGYTPNGFSEKVFHLHIKPCGDWNELYFRDYLQNHKEIARQYEKLKQNLQQQFEHDRAAYTKAKTEFIIENTKKARTEYKKRYFPTNIF